MKKYFWLWWTTFWLMAIGALFVGYFDFFTIIYSNDQTYISLAITISFVVSSIVTGWRTWLLSYRDVYTNTRIGWFAVGIFPTLGMIGTVIGLMAMFGGSFAIFTPGDLAVTVELMKELGIGLMIALSTTLCGLCAALGLKFQLEILDYGIDNYQET